MPLSQSATLQNAFGFARASWAPHHKRSREGASGRRKKGPQLPCAPHAAGAVVADTQLLDDIGQFKSWSSDGHEPLCHLALPLTSIGPRLSIRIVTARLKVPAETDPAGYPSTHADANSQHTPRHIERNYACLRAGQPVRWRANWIEPSRHVVVNVPCGINHFERIEKSCGVIDRGRARRLQPCSVAVFNLLEPRGVQ